MHKKPDRPFATIRFAKDGSVSPNVEHTDLPQKELELVVAKKFCSTLQARSLTTLTNLQRGNDPADVRATNERGELILIQIVEVVDQRRRKIDASRDSLRRHLEADADLRDLFKGCAVSVVTSGEETELSLSNEHVGAQLAEFGSDINTLQIGKRRCHRLASPDNRPPMYCEIERVPDKDLRRFTVTGGIVPDGTNWFLEVIEQKVRKRYAEPPAEFWLLAYSRDVLLQPEDPHMAAVHIFLNGTRHPFARVWYFNPFPNADLGSAIQVWPVIDILPRLSKQSNE